MQPKHRTPNRSAIALIRHLFRAIGLMDGAPLSVKNAHRRLPQARAAVRRLQTRSNDDNAQLRVWTSPIGDLTHYEA